MLTKTAFAIAITATLVTAPVKEGEVAKPVPLVYQKVQAEQALTMDEWAEYVRQLDTDIKAKGGVEVVSEPISEPISEPVAKEGKIMVK